MVQNLGRSTDALSGNSELVVSSIFPLSELGNDSAAEAVSTFRLVSPMSDPASLPLDLPFEVEADPLAEKTVAAVNWDILAAVACSIHGATTSRWGLQTSGGYNVARFLHLDDANYTVLVVRLPYLPEDGWTVEYTKSFAPQMTCEVATMQYLTSHTSIPVPRVIRYSVDADGGGVGSPYMLMTKVDGVSLYSIWDDMDDAKREIVLRQVVDILLELASHRFNKIGVLSKRECDGDSNESWYISPIVNSPDDPSYSQAMPSTTFNSSIDYSLAYANAYLENIRNTNFGHKDKPETFAIAWFMRSLIPALYDTSLDTAGFPLCPGDFHSQNIMITDADTSPRITGVIDWEFTRTRATSTFAQYPLFIVDNPLRPDGNPLRQRNVRDQATFNSLMRQAEMKRDSTGDLPLSRAFAKCQGVYLYEQAIQYSFIFPAIYPQLFAHVFGKGDFSGEDDSSGEDDDSSGEGDFSDSYYRALTEHGILRKETQQFERETEVRDEAVKILGDELVPITLSKDEFRNLVWKYVDQFPEGGPVRDWLTTQD